MKHLFILHLFVFAATFYSAQNSVRLFSAGSLFKVVAGNNLVNPNMQAEVLIENGVKDTLVLKLEFEDHTQAETILYLGDQGKKTDDKEFDYRLDFSQKPVRLVFIGMYARMHLHQPLVPEKPSVDTSLKYNNNLLGHFCELKNGKPVYFNNLPRSGSCALPMPEAYLNYARLLLKLAQTDDARLKVVENLCRNNCLSVAQLNALLPYVSYEVEKLRLVKIAYFNLTDAASGKELEKSFRFESSVRELDHFLKSAAARPALRGGNCQRASDSAQITTFCQELSVFKNDAQRFEAFKKIYDQYCYTITQVRQVLGQFIHDREKLDIAEQLYFYCTEKEKYGTLSDLFSYKETALELADFISKQEL